jgi:hypothetical protein
VTLLTLLLAQMPHIIAYLSTPPEMTFIGSVVNHQDTSSYLAEIRQGMEGEWLFHDRYTSEPHEGGPLFLFYISLGHMAGILGLSPPAVFTIARIVCGLILLSTAYWFLTLFLPRRQQRRTAYLLVCFSSGLGWIAMIFWPLLLLMGREPIDMWVPEANTFSTLLGVPHFALSVSLMLITLGGLVVAFRSGRWRPVWAAALACFALSWIHPFDTLIIGAVLATYLAWHTVERRRIPWREVGQVTPCFALSLPVVLYLQFGVIAPNPVFRAWLDQGITRLPSLLATLFGFGLLAVLASIGAWRTVRYRQIDPLPLCWVGAVVVLLLLPTNVQRRFLEGIHIPLCILAAVGWPVVWQIVQGQGILKSSLRILLLVGLLSSTLVVWGAATANGLSHTNPYFLYRYETEAFDWLEAHSDSDDTVLSSAQTGIYIPAWAGNRVFIGHWDQTIYLTEKEELLEGIFYAATPPARREEIIQAYGIAYLYHGPSERELGGYDPSLDSIWEPVFSNAEITIYRSTLSR